MILDTIRCWYSLEERSNLKIWKSDKVMYQMCKTVFFFFLLSIQSLASQPCTFFTYLLKTFQTFPLLKLILIAQSSLRDLKKLLSFSLAPWLWVREPGGLWFLQRAWRYVCVGSPPEGCRASLRCMGTGLVWWDWAGSLRIQVMWWRSDGGTEAWIGLEGGGLERARGGLAPQWPGAQGVPPDGRGHKQAERCDSVSPQVKPRGGPLGHLSPVGLKGGRTVKSAGCDGGRPGATEGGLCGWDCREASWMCGHERWAGWTLEAGGGCSCRSTPGGTTHNAGPRAQTISLFQKTQVVINYLKMYNMKKGIQFGIC